MVTATHVHDAIDEIMPGMIADRRHLHENPELGFEEVRTAAFVADRLRDLGVEDIRTGVNRTGVTGLVRGTARSDGGDRVVLVRADMDALPIQEENDVEYRSKTDGTMHACGHDAHTAILLGLARVLMDRREAFTGTVKLLFQPSEEQQPGGAIGMIEAGVLEDPAVDAVFGLHMAQESPLGTIAVAGGPVMAAADGFTLTIQGKGGHAAYPDTTVDPVVIGAQIVSAFQSLVSRETGPTEAAVITTTIFRAGDAFNVIPDIAELAGTVRTFNPDIRDNLELRMGEVARGVAAAMRATAEFAYQRGYPATVNDPRGAEIVRRAAVGVVGEDNVNVAKPQMGGEDFSYFLIERPGAFFFVGSKNEERGLVWGHHHPRFDIDEESMAPGLETMTRTVLAYLAEGLGDAAE